MTVKTIRTLLCRTIPLLALLSCGTSRQATQPGNTTEAPAEVYKQKVAANSQQAAALTAHLKLDLQAAGKNLSVGGTLRMKRDDVIQLSLTFIGMEVGRMEFTTDQVLVIDRFNKQYVRVPYNQVGFLQSAGLDFYTLQALFWNELFVPGTHATPLPLQPFRVASSGDHTLLMLDSAPKLDYAFLTRTADALIDRVTVTSKALNEPTSLVWKYADFAPVKGKQFPRSMQIAVEGTGKNYSVSLALSNVNNDENWKTRTEIPSRYKEQDIDRILRKLISFE